MVASIAMAALFFLYSAIMNTYVPIYGRKEVGLTDSQIASFSGYRNLAILLIRLSSITILSKLVTTRFLTAVLVLGGVVGLASPYTNSYHGLTLVMFLYGASFGATILLGSTLVANMSTPSNRGVANSIYSLAQSSGTMAQMLTTPVAEMSLTSVFTLGGALPLLATVPIILTSNIRTRNK